MLYHKGHSPIKDPVSTLNQTKIAAGSGATSLLEALISVSISSLWISMRSPEGKGTLLIAHVWLPSEILVLCLEPASGSWMQLSPTESSESFSLAMLTEFPKSSLVDKPQTMSIRLFP